MLESRDANLQAVSILWKLRSGMSKLPSRTSSECESDQVKSTTHIGYKEIPNLDTSGNAEYTAEVWLENEAQYQNLSSAIHNETEQNLPLSSGTAIGKN